MEDTRMHLDANQLRHIIAAILAAGCAAGQENGVTPEIAVTYYTRALQQMRQHGS